MQRKVPLAITLFISQKDQNILKLYFAILMFI